MELKKEVLAHIKANTKFNDVSKYVSTRTLAEKLSTSVTQINKVCQELHKDGAIQMIDNYNGSSIDLRGWIRVKDSRGAKPVADKKITVTLMVRASIIEAHGGQDELKKNCYQFLKQG